jgi:hypothetical protein
MLDLGFVSAILPNKSLFEVLDYAKQQNFGKFSQLADTRAHIALATEDDLRGWKQDLDVIENPVRT